MALPFAMAPLQGEDQAEERRGGAGRGGEAHHKDSGEVNDRRSNEWRGREEEGGGNIGREQRVLLQAEV
eukprot:750158-Hanusia_phi.AAC.1